MDDLRAQLDQAREEIRWLKKEMLPQPGWLAPWEYRTQLPRTSQLVLWTLAKAKHPLTEKELHRKLELIVGKDVGIKNVAIVILRIRQKLDQIKPRITIHSQRCVGYWINPDDKAALLGDTEWKAKQ